MKSLEINCAGELLQLFAEKAIFWRRRKTLIIADSHFGKAAAFRHAGIPVPENVTANDLHRLDELLHETASRRLIILGDLLHAKNGRSEVMMHAFQNWRDSQADLEIDLVIGNHDKRSGALPDSWKINWFQDSFEELPFAFCHEPKTISGAFTFAGHIHPAISSSRQFGTTMRLPCFHFFKNCAILPAFGSFTGTHTISPTREDRIFVIHAGEILAMPSILF